MNKIKFIILTPLEVEEIYSFSKLKKQNVVIRSANCGGIGDSLHITTQNDYNCRMNNWVDITDYEAF